MPALGAVGSNSQITYVAETVFGTTPTTPTMKVLRAKMGSKFELKRDTFESKEMSATRQLMALGYGNKSGSADIPIELSYGSYDDLLEAVTGGTWTANVLKVGTVKRSFTMEQQHPDIAISEINTGVVFNAFNLSVKPNAIVEGSFSAMFKDQATTQTVASAAGTGATAFTATTITRASGSFSTDGFVNGDIIQIQGAKTAANNKVATIVTVAALSLTFAAATFTVDAADQTDLVLSKTLSLSPTAANTNTVFDSFTGSLTEGGVTLAIVTGVEVKLDQSADVSNVLFDATAQQVSLGTVKVTGTVTVRFVNNTLKKKFLSATGTTLAFTLGVTSKMYAFNFANVKYTSATNDSVESELSQTLNFTAIYDGTDTTSMKITRTP